MIELDPTPGWVADDVRAEFPDLRLLNLVVDCAPRRSPPEIRWRLDDLSDRFGGQQAVAMRRSAIPSAYRVFFRQIGLDPDVTRTPIEAAALDRLVKGGWRSQNLLDDAMTISLVETGVPLWALDARTVQGRLGIRSAAAGERLGRVAEAPPQLPSGCLVIADEHTPLAVLFGELAPGHGVGADTTRMTLFTLGVAGVPEIHVEEALHSCAATLTGA